ncbi:phage tail assembly protein T [Euryhalocaulis caribicus]|uniref:phage tail assembly protein T n=1 Tax=Euryhalocaulis caribicus TaxID=1161401 RepID=UPI00039C5374|nr:hypothetical protein [Euryhalocaulis caribicus]
MTAGELRRRMDSAELTEWMAYERAEPFWPERIEAMMAQQTALIANIHRGKGQAPFDWRDFSFSFRLTPEQKRQEMAARLRMTVTAMTGIEAR